MKNGTNQNARVNFALTRLVSVCMIPDTCLVLCTHQHMCMYFMCVCNVHIRCMYVLTDDLIDLQIHPQRELGEHERDVPEHIQKEHAIPGHDVAVPGMVFQ
jgi:hypothetical protein